MDESQATVSLDCLHWVVILAYLLANLTQWMTHCTAFIQLLMVQDAIILAVMQKQNTIIAAEVGTATDVKARELTDNAEHWCSVVKDGICWEGLEHVISDLEPICHVTNIASYCLAWWESSSILPSIPSKMLQGH